MPMYRTAYSTHKGRRQVTQCYAESLTHLDEVMKQRGMGEYYDPAYGMSFLQTPNMASTLLREGKYAAANHALIWTSMIAAKAGLSDAWQLLNDDGIVHDMAHFLHSAEERHFGFFNTKDMEAYRLADRIETFERLVPGVHPCWAGEDTKEPRSPWTMHGIIYGDLKSLEESMERMRARAKDTIIIMDEVSFALGNHEAKSLEERVYAAPKAKPGSRKFAEHQRNQGAAVKAKSKADLVAKMKLKAAENARADTVKDNLCREVPLPKSYITELEGLTFLDQLQARGRADRKSGALAPINFLKLKPEQDTEFGVTPEPKADLNLRLKSSVNADLKALDDAISEAGQTLITGKMKKIMQQNMERMLAGTVTGRMAHSIPEMQELPRPKGGPIRPLPETLRRGDMVVSFDPASKKGDKTVVFDIETDGLLAHQRPRDIAVTGEVTAYFRDEKLLEQMING